jgi:hypothetical protein
MPLGVASMQWDMRMPWGSKVAWAFNMFQAGGIVPYTITGHTFEYVVKAQPSDVSPIFKITSDGGVQTPGSLVLQTTTDESSVILTLYPAATKTLTAPLQAYHALWMDYADTQNARNLMWGSFFLDPSIQP